jgi:hypothetical protein
MNRARHLVFAVLALTCAAHADGIHPGRTAFGAIPVGVLHGPQAAPPKRPIAASEHVNGFRLAFQGDGEQRFAVLGENAEKKPDTYCFTNVQEAGDAVSEGRWQDEINSSLLIQVANASGPQNVRGERIVDDKDGAYLEAVSVWIEPSNGGIRTADHDRLKLLQVGTGPGGIRYYAARDRDTVEFFVRQTDADHEIIGTSSLGAMRSSTCGYSHVRLEAKKGESSIASVVAQVKLAKEGSHPKAGNGAKDAKDAKDAEESEDAQDTRFRALRVNAGLSWASRDTEPVFTVSQGWIGAPRGGMSGGFAD